MSADERKAVEEICRKHANDPGRLMDLAVEVQERFRRVSPAATDIIAKALSIPRVEVESLVSFYAFLGGEPRGKIAIRLCDDIVDRQNGSRDVGQALSEAFGIPFGRTTPDGLVSLEYAPCIGMCDQAPAALVNDVVVTHLTPSGAKELAREIKRQQDPKKLVRTLGDGKNAHSLVQAMVVNNLRRRGEVIFAEAKVGDGLRKALAMQPAEVIRNLKTARLRGRGGAGFPTGLKWEFTRKAEGSDKCVICNADEGEPGTFKDRVILTECPELLFEGMAIAGYAIGAREGIIYLRGEYAYLRAYLEGVLGGLRRDGILGPRILGKDFAFDVRIQIGAGAYICGEETSLISSCEGQRGDPKTRPPFPAQKGYLGRPTTVNNVETFCCVARILDKGAGWFLGLGSKGSPGTKLLSISGDCRIPGVFEIPFGTKLGEVLAMAGASDPAAVQIGGPSGRMVFPKDFGRAIDYDDLATGGSIMVFNRDRDLLEVTRYFMEFFIEESCGYCTPCRVGNLLLKEKLDKILDGHGEGQDLDYLRNLGACIKSASRCGLGQTSPNPVLSTLEGCPELYESRLSGKTERGMQSGFDLGAALREAEAIARRRSIHAEV